MPHLQHSCLLLEKQARSWRLSIVLRNLWKERGFQDVILLECSGGGIHTPLPVRHAVHIRCVAYMERCTVDLTMQGGLCRH
jgi:hypothetical protein